MKFSTQDLLSDRDGPTPAEVGADTPDECRLTEELAFQDETRDEAAIVGDPEEVADKIRPHHEALGVTPVMAAVPRGGLGHNRVRRSVRLFADRVMPRFA